MNYQSPSGYDPFRKDDPFRKNGKQSRFTKKRSKILLIVVIVAMLAIEIPLQFEARKFYYRFAEAITVNQRAVFEMSRNQFSPEFNELINLYRYSTETPPIMKQMEVVRSTSEALGDLLQEAEAKFPYDEFTEQEQERIRDFYVVLDALDQERQRHVLETNECIRTKLLRLNGAEDLCAEEDIRWNTNMPQLQSQLYATLELPPEQQEKFKKIYLAAMHVE